MGATVQIKVLNYDTRKLTAVAAKYAGINSNIATTKKCNLTIKQISHIHKKYERM